MSELEMELENKVSYEKWEKLPSDIRLTRGECNRLHNILTSCNLPTGWGKIDVTEILRKLEKEI